MVRKLQAPEERQTEILDAAKELFLTRCYDETTVGNVIEKAGIARETRIIKTMMRCWLIFTGQRMRL